MKIRTTEQLYDFMSKEISWRRKEMSEFKALILSNRNSINRQKALLRSAVAILYAHWEGFCKNVSTAYLEYVSLKRLSYNELSDNFIALGIKSKLDEFVTSNSVALHVHLIDFLLRRLPQRSAIPYRNVIHTRSNLSSSVFKEIVITLGLDYTGFSTKEKIIDEQLVKNRNSIAHGEYVLVDEQAFIELHAQIFAIMNELRNQIDNHAAQELYKAA